MNASAVRLFLFGAVSRCFSGLSGSVEPTLLNDRFAVRERLRRAEQEVRADREIVRIASELSRYPPWVAERALARLRALLIDEGDRGA